MQAMSFISCCTHRGGTGRTGQSRRNRQWGATAVEFAVVSPILFLMIFGMIEYGRMIMVQQILTSATREGARMAGLDGVTTTATNN